MQHDTDPDLPLLQAMAQGDKSALNELYARHGQHILSYLIGQLSDRQLAEEVLQDVMLAVWHSANRFRAESKVKTWMMSIARFQMLQARRRHKLTSVPLNDELFSDSTGPPGILQTKLDRQAVREAIRRLPADQQETLELIFYHDLTGPEAAEILGVSPGTIKSRIHRAKKQLRGLLQEAKP